MSTSGRIDYTVDGGSHWRQGNGAHNAVAIDFVDSLNGWAVTARYSGAAVTYGPLLHTTDGGASWSRLPVPPEGGLVTLDFTDDLVGYGLTSAGTLLFTNDRGETWRRIRTPVAISDLCFVNDLEGWIAGGGTIYFLNAGVLTTSLPKSRVGTAANLVPTPTLSCAGQTVWADYVFRIGNGNASTVLVRSLDGGTHWKVRLSEWYSVPGPEHGSEFDAYTNAFGVADSEHAWFLGSCLACQYGEISMTRTKDGGAHFSHTFVLFSRRAFFTPALQRSLMPPTAGCWSLSRPSILGGWRTCCSESTMEARPGTSLRDRHPRPETSFQPVSLRCRPRPSMPMRSIHLRDMQTRPTRATCEC